MIRRIKVRMVRVGIETESKRSRVTWTRIVRAVEGMTIDEGQQTDNVVARQVYRFPAVALQLPGYSTQASPCSVLASSIRHLCL